MNRAGCSPTLHKMSHFVESIMSLAEILEELPKLTEEERDELRSRLDETIPADQVIAEGRRLAQEPAQQ